MKTPPNQKHANSISSLAIPKPPPARSAAKTQIHRYERRKIREQLRHLDWALAGVD